MKTKRAIGAVLGLALVALGATGALAERPGQAMADVTARLEAASTHAAVLEAALERQAPMPVLPAAAPDRPLPGGHDLGRPDGGGYPAEGALPPRPARPLTPDMTAALDGLEAAVQEARNLAGGHAYLEPGMAHVLANAHKLRHGAAEPVDATSLGHEIAIELLAVANNARVLQAEAELRAASFALDRDQAGAFRDHLQAAVGVMGRAKEKGAYHLEDDMATAQVVLARLEGGARPREAVAPEAMDELIDDVHEHLADLGGD